jgi:hypothetical protein
MSWFDRVAMSCIVYMVSCNSTIYATCPLALATYKYNEFQVSDATQFLSCKASCKTPLFLIVTISFATNPCSHPHSTKNVVIFGQTP